MSKLWKKLLSWIQADRRDEKMNTFYMAVKNLKNNISFYTLYLVSVALVITIFFAFASFSANKVMMEKISADGRVETMCNIISVFLILFVIFYMTYSNRFFLRRRIKELGIYTLLGYRKKTILSLLTFENILICCGAFIVGIILGGVAHKGIVYIINQLLNLGINNSEISVFNVNAFCKTGIFMFFIIAFLVISNSRLLYKTSLIEIIRYEKRAEKKVKLYKIPAILGIVMILGGYIIALDIQRGIKSVWMTVGFYQMGLLTLFIVITGTVLFIASFLPYAVRKGKEHKKSFYTSTKIITMPNFIYHIRSNSKTLIMLTLLSAAALTISSVMALTVYYPIAAVTRVAPSEIEFRLENKLQMKDIKQLVEEHTQNVNNVTFTETKIYKVTSFSDNLPIEYNLSSSKNGARNENILREAGFECISYSQYITLLEAQGKSNLSKTLTPLSKKECILMKYQQEDNKHTEKGHQYTLDFNGTERTVVVKEVSLNNPISFANSIGTLIISDKLYKEAKESQLPSSIVVSMNGSSLKDNEELYSAISNYLGVSPYLQGNSHRINELLHLNSSTFLLIGFLVILFFIAAGSILYFNNISSVMDSKADYEILIKIGYTKKHIKKIIKKQILTFFSIPFLLGLLDCIFAVLVYKYGLMQNLLENSFNQYIPVLLAIVLTAIIYCIYYMLTVKACYKIVSK